MVGEWKSTKSAGGNLKSRLASSALHWTGRENEFKCPLGITLESFLLRHCEVHLNIFHNIYILSISIRRKNRTNISSSWFMHQIFSTGNFLNYLHCSRLSIFLSVSGSPLTDWLNDWHEMIEKTHFNFIQDYAWIIATFNWMRSMTKLSGVEYTRKTEVCNSAHLSKINSRLSHDNLFYLAKIIN